VAAIVAQSNTPSAIALVGVGVSNLKGLSSLSFEIPEKSMKKTESVIFTAFYLIPIFSLF
jgi:hypothetical protein